MSRRNDIEFIPTVKMEKTIIIPLEEYKQLLITKGRYEEMKESNTLIVTEEEVQKADRIVFECREENKKC